MPSSHESGEQPVICRVPPYNYIHVIDSNTNVTRVICGPATYTRADHERILLGPEKMIIVPPRHYVVIGNPVMRKGSEIIVDPYDQAKLRHGDFEIRMIDSFSDPFPLYPGEFQEGVIRKLQVVEKNQAVKLKAVRDFEDSDGVKRVAGDEWLFSGPGTYIPRVEVEEQGVANAVIIKHSQALKLRALRSTIDHTHTERRAGEEWLVRAEGAFLPSIDTEVVKTVRAMTLTDRRALHLVATKTFTDVYGSERKAGEEWLVTIGMAESHIPDVHEQVLGEVFITTLTSRQYAVISDPFVDGEQRLGTKRLIKGEASFFLKPGEQLEGGILDVFVLADDEALLLQAHESFVDKSASEDDVSRRPGDRWMIYGPREFIPPCEVSVIESRKAIPLDENEGLYVRNNRTGAVRAVIGETYMLSPHEELWEKHLPDEVEDLLQKQKLGMAYVPPTKYEKSASKKTIEDLDISASTRDKTKVVQFRVPHNAACQVYDFKKKTSRVVYGPDLVVLQPDEQFTIISLSGDKPKRPNCIKSLTLMLGPDFMTDIIIVETSDHARLRLTLAYNWHFDVSREEPSARIFNVRDFTGDACKAMASRIRGAVASETFDHFHKNSAKLIRGSVFGLKDGKVGDKLAFEANGLVITNVDIQSVEPVDQSTRESLQKSVQLAIQITTQSQEARARHDAHREEEEAKGKLERQKLINEANAEAERKHLLELKAESNAVVSSGTATAEARARAAAAKIEGEAQVLQAELKAQATRIEMEAKLQAMKMQHEAEILHQEEVNRLEIERAERLANIEANKFKMTVEAIGPETIKAIARAGPEMQAKLLQGLGLKGYLVTDGKSPINLLNTAAGLVGGAGGIGTPNSI